MSLLFFSFHVASITDPNLTSTEARFAKDWTVPFAADLIQQAERQSGTYAGVDPEHEALLLMSAYTGLSLGLVAGVRNVDEALNAIDYRLDQIFNNKPTTPVLPNMSNVAAATSHRA